MELEFQFQIASQQSQQRVSVMLGKRTVTKSFSLQLSKEKNIIDTVFDKTKKERKEKDYQMLMQTQ